MLLRPAALALFRRCKPREKSAPSDIAPLSRASKRAAQQHRLRVLRQIDIASELTGSTSKYVQDPWSVTAAWQAWMPTAAVRM